MIDLERILGINWFLWHYISRFDQNLV